MNFIDFLCRYLLSQHSKASILFTELEKIMIFKKHHKFFLVGLLLFNIQSFSQEKGFLTKEEIEIFHKQGYLIKKKCFDSSTMLDLVLQTQNAINIAIGTIEETPLGYTEDKEAFIYINGSRVVYEKKDAKTSIAKINGCGGIEPLLLNIMQSSKIIHTFFELLDTDQIEHLICQIHPKLPFDGISFRAHRDVEFRKSFDPNWTDILGNGSWAICVIPVDPMSELNGGLWIDTGSYLNESQSCIEWINTEPGDILFLHPYILHGSGPNLSNKPRRTLLTGFCAFGANHCNYPGAHVNYKFSLNASTEIIKEKCEWNLNTMQSNGH